VLLSIRIQSDFDIESFKQRNSTKRGIVFTFLSPSKNANISTEYREAQKSSHNIKICQNESQLLGEFLNLLDNFDVDFICSFSLPDMELPLLARRLAARKVPQAYRLGRVNRDKKYNSIFSNVDKMIPGRLPIDVKTSCIEFVYSKANDMSSIVEKELSTPRQSIEKFDIGYILSNNEQLKNFVLYNICDSIFLEQLVSRIQLLPLTLIFLDYLLVLGQEFF
jgi:DNA polymerase elongation subunit (family B)